MINSNIRKYKSIRVRLYPNKSQEILINKTFGCCRKIYNEHLQERNEFYLNNILPIRNSATKEELRQVWKTYKPKSEKEWKEIYPYLKEVSSQALVQSRMDCDFAFQNFYDSLLGKINKKVGFPKFKSKKENYQHYRECTNIKLLFNEQRISLLKLGFIKFRNNSKPKWWNQFVRVFNVTVEKTSSGKYFAAIVCEIEPRLNVIQNRKDSIGLDFSPELCYVDSDGNNAKDNFGYIPQKQAHYKQLKKLERQLSRKQKGSNNRNKARIKVARLEEHIANCRRDWIEKETLRLVTNYDKVVVEDLNLIAISKFFKNARNLKDTSWGKFTTRLLEKSKDYNCLVIKADRFFPSSQLCSNCGYQYHELKLYMRKWVCPSCHKEHIRDVNAAINLKNYVPQELRESMPVEDIDALASLALANAEYPMKQEKQTIA